MAREQAIDAITADIAMCAVAKLDELYVIDPFAMESDVVSRIFRKATTVQQLTELVDQLLPLSERASAAGRFDLAHRWIDLAHVSADKWHDKALASAAVAGARRIAAEETRAASVARAMVALQANPNDPQANLAIGIDYCVGKRDWNSSLPFLRRANDSPLKALATEELKSPSDPSDQVHLANGWWELADKCRPLSGTRTD